jgi:glycosyltransferase involved in cell wall biosynthesis
MSSGAEGGVVVFFPLCLQKIHLTKDVVQLGLALAKERNRELALVALGSEEGLELPEGVTFYDLTHKRARTSLPVLILRLARYLFASRGRVLLFLSYFWGAWSWISVTVYRVLNRGFSIVKLDGNPTRILDLVNTKSGVIRTWLRRRGFNLFGLSVDLISCESQELLSSMKLLVADSNIGSRLALLPNGVSDAFLESAWSSAGKALDSPGKLKILLLGRINEPSKGLEIFLSALCHLENTSVHFYVCGPSGTWSDSVLASHFKNRPEDRKRLTVIPEARGAEEVVAVISSAHVLCLPSFDTPEAVEGAPLVLAEAMACGAYFLASDAVPYAQDLCGGGRFGDIFRNRDGADLANKIKSVFESPEILARVKEEGPRQVAEQYTWGVIAERALALCVESRKGNRLS